MSRKQPTGIIHLRASRVLVAWVAVTALCAVFLLFWFLATPAAIAAGCLVLIHAWHMLRLHALRRHPEALVALQVRGDEFTYQLRCGHWHGGTLPAGGMVTRWLLLTRLHDAGEKSRHRTLVVGADALDAEDYRRLRVYLRWGWRDPARNPDLTV